MHITSIFCVFDAVYQNQSTLQFETKFLRFGSTHTKTHKETCSCTSHPQTAFVWMNARTTSLVLQPLDAYEFIISMAFTILEKKQQTHTHTHTKHHTCYIWLVDPWLCTASGCSLNSSAPAVKVLATTSNTSSWRCVHAGHQGATRSTHRRRAHLCNVVL